MPDTQISEPLTQVERLRLAIALTESYNDRVFEIEPECVEALLKEYDELRDKYNKITAALSGHVVVPREPTQAMLLAAFKEANEQLLRTDGNAHCKSDEERSAHAIAPVYRAMIQAAPPVDGGIGDAG